MLMAMNGLVWAAVPPALVAGAFWFIRKNGLPVPAGTFGILFTTVPLAWGSFYFFCQKKYRTAFSTMIVSMLFFSSLSYGWLLPQIETAISSKKWAEKYGKSAEGHSTVYLLTSKMFVRGFSYYSGNSHIGVFSGKPGGGFYTPHPIRIISDAQELAKINTGKLPVYFLLRKKEWNFLKTIVGKQDSLSVLEDTPQRMWVRLDRA
jgi:hypothetical protein